MTSKEILEDFICYILLQQEELISPIPFFFDQENGGSIADLVPHFNYQSFIRQVVDVDQLYIEDLPLGKETLSYEEFIKAVDVPLLIEYINSNFIRGYSYDMDENGEGIGGYEPLKITNEEIRSLGAEYHFLHNVHPKVYVSFLLQVYAFHYPEYGKWKKKVDDLWAYSRIIPASLSEEYSHFKREEMKKDFFKEIEHRPFQFFGFLDEEGLYIDHIATLLKWLETSKVHPISYDLMKLNFRPSYNFLTYQYFEYKFFGESIGFSSDDNLNDLMKEFAQFKTRNSNLLNYLSKKGFNSVEIDFILNVLSGNRFSSLNIRKMRINKVEFFQLAYLFYIFDFQKEICDVSFDREKDFEALYLTKKEHTEMIVSNNQLSKNYKSQDSPDSKHYPFTRVQFTYNKLYSILPNLEGKLKAVPEQKKFRV